MMLALQVCAQAGHAAARKSATAVAMENACSPKPGRVGCGPGWPDALRIIGCLSDPVIAVRIYSHTLVEFFRVNSCRPAP